MSDKLDCRIDQNTSDPSILFARTVLRAVVRPTDVGKDLGRSDRRWWRLPRRTGCPTVIEAPTWGLVRDVVAQGEG
jgi:hypothetical protein